RRGRLLDEHDGAGAPRVAMISESMARRRLPGRDPIGQRLHIGDGPLYTVVGVVGDVKQMSLALNEADAVYVTATQWRFADNVMSLVVRARGDAAALAPAVRQAVWSIDQDQPVVRVSTMDALVAGSVAERTREIGVRAALGASRGSILGLVVRQAMLLTGLGVAMGLAGAAAATQAIEAM